jgi:Fic/DOC family
MDLTPAFFDRWREHRELDYVDRVRDVFEESDPDEEWLERARRRARALETHASLDLAGLRIGDATDVAAVLDGDDADVDTAAVQSFAAAYDDALAAAHEQAPLTPALLDSLHARLGIGPAGASAAGAGLQRLCDWLAAPPDDLHPAVVAALAHLEVLRLRPWPDGNARLARLLLLVVLDHGGYGYRDLLAPSVAWHDPRKLPDRPIEEFSPETAETHPAVEHTVHDIATAVRDMVAWVRAEESPGSLQAMLFGFPVQP